MPYPPNPSQKAIRQNVNLRSVLGLSWGQFSHNVIIQRGVSLNYLKCLHLVIYYQSLVSKVHFFPIITDYSRRMCLIGAKVQQIPEL